MRSWCLAVAALSVLLGADPEASASSTPEIWFSPLTWEISPTTKHIDYSTHDFPDLLKHDAPWREAGSHVSVVSLPHNVVWSYPDRASLVRFFNDHAFKTALSFGMLFDDGACAKNVEGVSHDHDVNRESVVVAQQWKEAGGRLDYVIMDGPLAFGHFLAASCTNSIPTTARRAVSTLRAIRDYFPDVLVVDAEGPAGLPNAEWLSMMDTWLSEFKQQAGQPIESVVLDLHWVDLRAGNTWQATAQRSAAFFHARGVRTGLVVNDDRSGPNITDRAWMQANRDHISEVVRNRGLGLDYLLINGWMGHPYRNLPESDQTAYTSLVNFAFHALAP